jgi:hypothetical protein
LLDEATRNKPFSAPKYSSTIFPVHQITILLLPEGFLNALTFDYTLLLHVLTLPLIEKLFSYTELKKNLFYWSSMVMALHGMAPHKSLPGTFPNYGVLLTFFTTIITCTLRTISVRSQFLLTLMILRRNRRFTDIHFHFHIGQALVGRIFKTWIQFMFHKFKDIKAIMFVKKADIKKPLPACFDNPFCRDTRVVIDCTEIFTESSTDFKQQGHLHSNYKSHTTAKVLLGVAPSGACSFVSDCFEGCISDVDITKQSGFLDYMEKGDVVLADRGFTIEDLLSPMGAKLNMPAFLRGKKAFTLSDKQKGQVFAKARIHVERFNQCFKRFEFVSGRVSQKHLPILSQVVYVCCCLTNFTRRLADVKPPDST